MTVPKWWIDASFAVQKDMKSQTGGILTTGKGAIYSASKKHTLNTKSSIEAEIVGVNDLMPVVCWTRYFLEGQGDDMKPSKIYQDNMSSILLEKNGKASSGKNARHITIRYFFITDRVKPGEAEIEYCPIKEMLGICLQSHYKVHSSGLSGTRS